MYTRVQRFDTGIYTTDEDLARVLHKSIDYISGIAFVIKQSNSLGANPDPNAEIKEVPGIDRTHKPITIYMLNKNACMSLLSMFPDTENLKQAYAFLFDTLEKSGEEYEYHTGDLDADNKLTKATLVCYPVCFGDSDPIEGTWVKQHTGLINGCDYWVPKLTPDQVLRGI
jgi:ssDNA-specific exonuclease RecJ